MHHWSVSIDAGISHNEEFIGPNEILFCKTYILASNSLLIQQIDATVLDYGAVVGTQRKVTVISDVIEMLVL